MSGFVGSMCGRFSLTPTQQDVEDLFGLGDLEDFPPRYNIAPTQPILVVASNEIPPPGSNRPPRRSLLARWGFLPSWVKDPKGFPLLINARSETAIEKSSFRAAMRHRRVLIPASGFYEWKRREGARPEPYWVASTIHPLIGFAGLLETWIGPDGSEIDTAAILTTRASSDLAPIHHRMPVVIKPDDFTRWLECRTQEPRHVADLMEPVEAGFFSAVRVSDKVNKVANTGPEIQEPAPAAEADETVTKTSDAQLTLF